MFLAMLWGASRAVKFLHFLLCQKWTIGGLTVLLVI